MTLEELLHFLRSGIKVSHIYQPVLIRSLLDSGGYCTLRQLGFGSSHARGESNPVL